MLSGTEARPEVVSFLSLPCPQRQDKSPTCQPGVALCAHWGKAVEGHGSVSKLLTAQAPGPEFDSPHPCKETGVVVQGLNPEVETTDPGARWPAWPS